MVISYNPIGKNLRSLFCVFLPPSSREMQLHIHAFWIRHHICSQSPIRMHDAHGLCNGQTSAPNIAEEEQDWGEQSRRRKERLEWRAGKDAGVTIHRSAGSCLREPPAAPASAPAEKRQVHFTKAPPVRSVYKPTQVGPVNKPLHSFMVFIYGNVHLIFHKY